MSDDRSALLLFFSSQSHYSIKKASAALGFGTENLILLNTDERFVLTVNQRAVCRETDEICGLFTAALSFSRGRVIPADLEAKVIEAKQKVTVSNCSFEICCNETTLNISPSDSAHKWKCFFITDCDKLLRENHKVAMPETYPAFLTLF